MGTGSAGSSAIWKVTPDLGFAENVQPGVSNLPILEPITVENMSAE
jgi:hypothetical protein